MSGAGGGDGHRAAAHTSICTHMHALEVGCSLQPACKNRAADDHLRQSPTRPHQIHQPTMVPATLNTHPLMTSVLYDKVAKTTASEISKP